MRILICLLIYISCSVQLYAQDVESGWKGISVLKSNRAEVERILGKPKIDDNGYYIYMTEEAGVRISYATKPCVANRYGRGKFRVAEGTVLWMWVSIRKELPLSNLNYSPKNFFRDTSGDVANSITYVNVDSSIIISAAALDENGKEYVGRIIYSPSKRDEKALACKAIAKAKQ